MENKLAVHTKSCAAKSGRRFLALLLSCVLIFSLSACGGQKTTGKAEEINPVTVEHEPEPQALQTANEATTIALRQYVYARLLTEAFLMADASAMTAEELSEMADELLLAWKNAELFSSTAMELTDKAVLLMEMPTVKQTSAAGQPQAKFMTLAAAPLNFSLVAYAAESERKIDPQTWAENLTRQYDALKGAQRYQQLAQQLGTDAKTAYEQMALAQKIIHNAAELEETEGVVNAYTESINYLQGVKTASKVGVFVVGTVVTGGGSLTALSTSSFTLAQTAGTIVGGVDCIVDVAETGSTLILGENNQVAVAFGDIKEKLAPVSAVVGLASFNSAETGEQLAYIGDTLVDWFYEGKVMGVQVDDRTVTARIFDSAGTVALKSALESAGYVFPETSRTLTEIMEELETDPEASLARMDALVSQMAELERAAGPVEEVSPAPDSAASAPANESTESAAPSTSTGDISIFGRYSVVSRVINGEDEEEETSFATLVDLGAGKVQWIDDDDEEDDDPFIMSYDASSHKLYYFEEGAIVNVVFTSSGDKVMGKGTMTATLWGERVEATLSLTKISD
jgi:hypothetical protein